MHVFNKIAWDKVLPETISNWMVFTGIVASVHQIQVKDGLIQDL
jgi:Flp pilus assembly protein protease CpaA